MVNLKLFENCHTPSKCFRAGITFILIACQFFQSHSYLQDWLTLFPEVLTTQTTYSIDECFVQTLKERFSLKIVFFVFTSTQFLEALLKCLWHSTVKIPQKDTTIISHLYSDRLVLGHGVTHLTPLHLFLLQGLPLVRLLVLNNLWSPLSPYESTQYLAWELTRAHTHKKKLTTMHQIYTKHMTENFILTSLVTSTAMASWYRFFFKAFSHKSDIEFVQVVKIQHHGYSNNN